VFGFGRGLFRRDVPHSGVMLVDDPVTRPATVADRRSLTQSELSSDELGIASSSMMGDLVAPLSALQRR